MGITTSCSQSPGEQRKKGGSCEEMEKKAEAAADPERSSRSQGYAGRESVAQADGEELTSGQGGPNPAYQEPEDEEADVGSQPWRLFTERGFLSKWRPLKFQYFLTVAVAITHGKSSFQNMIPQNNTSSS